MIELTDEVIDNYFKAMQQVAQNKAQVQIDDILELSKENESDILSSVLGAVPVQTKEESELRSVISMLDNDTLVNMTRLKNSIEFSERL